MLQRCCCCCFDGESENRSLRSQEPLDIPENRSPSESELGVLMAKHFETEQALAQGGFIYIPTPTHLNEVSILDRVAGS